MNSAVKLTLIIAACLSIATTGFAQKDKGKTHDHMSGNMAGKRQHKPMHSTGKGHSKSHGKGHMSSHGKGHSMGHSTGHSKHEGVGNPTGPRGSKNKHPMTSHMGGPKPKGGTDQKS